MTEQLAAAYVGAGKVPNALVVPAGLSFAELTPPPPRPQSVRRRHPRLAQ